MSDDIEHIRVWHRTWADCDKSELEALRAENARLREALERLCKTAALLQQNAEGCAANHYGEDFQIHGMPGWLTDTAADIARAARAALKTKGEGDE